MKKYTYLLMVAFLVLSCSYHTYAQGIITTIAGIGTESYSGDDSAAVNAGLNGPYAVALDGLGNYYISDGYNSRIRKVDAAGIITTIAGTGVSGYNGDGILATAAQINHPCGLTFDHSGNLYISDALNCRIRKVDAITGIITTVAGNGIPGYNGDNITADTAELYDPHGVAFDASGNLYITDFDNHRVRKVNTSGIITTISGTGVPGYSGDSAAAAAAEINEPYGIATDNSGNIYFADFAENVVRKIDASGIITRFAGSGISGGSIGDNGPADSARFAGPTGLALDISNDLYIADGYDPRIRRVNATTGIITTVAGNGVVGHIGDNGLATAAELAQPAGVAIDNVGNLYIADFGNNCIRFVTSTEGTEQIYLLNKFLNIYPNPNSGTFNIQLTAIKNCNIKIVITSILGQTVKECTMPVFAGVNNFLIQLNDPDGIYILTAITNSKTWSEKIIVRK